MVSDQQTTHVGGLGVVRPVFARGAVVIVAPAEASAAPSLLTQK